jgi:hypothetical protein
MSKAKDTLEIIGQYYGTVRRVGHTHTAIEGLKDSEKAIFVVGSHASGQHFKNHLPKGVKTISINSIDPTLRGYNLPMVFDNEATFQLCKMALQEINSLDKIIDEKNTQMREKDEDILDLLDVMLKTVNEELAYHDHTKQQRLKYAEEYAYKALIKDRHSSKEYSNNNEKEALWHDGSRNGHEAAMYSLSKLKRCLEAVKAGGNFGKQK